MRFLAGWYHFMIMNLHKVTRYLADYLFQKCWTIASPKKRSRTIGGRTLEGIQSGTALVHMSIVISISERGQWLAVQACFYLHEYAHPYTSVSWNDNTSRTWYRNSERRKHNSRVRAQPLFWRWQSTHKHYHGNHSHGHKRLLMRHWIHGAALKSGTEVCIS